jgi:hypothetical protein
MLAVSKMTHFTFISLLTILVCQANAQSSTKCNCGAIVDIDFKGKIIVYDRPNGRVVKAFQQDFEKEDYLILTIEKDSVDYFYVDISNALTPKDGKRGWIKKIKEIGTYARNYQQNDTLILYSNSSLKSTPQSVVPDWTNELYTIVKCSKNWTYVRIKYKGQLKEGWLQPDKQCDNPYTTCN